MWGLSGRRIMTTLEVGRKLVDLIRSGRTMEALDTLYSRTW